MPASPDAAQCPTCRHTFATDDLFRAHRRGGRCTTPADLGLIRVGAIWSTILIGATR